MNRPRILTNASDKCEGPDGAVRVPQLRHGCEIKIPDSRHGCLLGIADVKGHLIHRRSLTPMEQYPKRTTVYSGRHSIVQVAEAENGQKVAIKVIDVDFSVAPHCYRRELRILQKLQGRPQFLQLIDHEMKGDDLFLITAFYSQFDLEKVFRAHLHQRTRFNWDDPSKNTVVTENRMPVEVIDQMFVSMVKTLSELHNQHQIIHRDIKPSNWLIGADITSPVLGDFGISYDGEGDEPATDKHTDVATGVYKAPELCFGVRDYGPEVDMWALGMMMTMLYSRDGAVVLDQGSRTEGSGSDLFLIGRIFAVLGTPTTSDAASANYWPQMADDRYTFNKFEFGQTSRISAEELVPRCESDEARRKVDAMLVYDGQRRMTAAAAQV